MRLTCRLVLATCAAILASACASFRGASIRVPAEPGTAGETTAQVSQQEISTVTEVVDGIATQHQLERATLPERSFKEPDGQPHLVAMYQARDSSGPNRRIFVSIDIAADRSEVVVGVADWGTVGGSKALDQISQEINDAIGRKLPDRRVSMSYKDLGAWGP
jgi:hypothetical protein